MLHSFLLIGQSNMAGRGHIANAAKLDTLDGRLKVLRNGRWQTMYRPVNPDRPFSGTCLAESFARDYALDHPTVEVGVIPCADGGTMLDQWAEGSLLYENAVNCARLAMRTSTLVGILWHQGESDCEEERYPHYLEKLTALMNALRRDLGAEAVPIIVGGLGDYLKENEGWRALVNYPHVNDALRAFASATPRAAFAPAEGLGSNPDLLHFHHDALMTFGHRYYTAFRTVENPALTASCAPAADTARTKMEEL